MTPSNAESTVIRRNGFVAEIIASRGREAQIFHYVVQREYSSGILYW